MGQASDGQANSGQEDGDPAGSMMRRGLLQLVPVLSTQVATASASPGP